MRKSKDNPRCMSCIHAESHGGDQLLTCRRLPPTPVLLQWGPGMRAPIFEWQWSAVAWLEWCGEFKRGRPYEPDDRPRPLKPLRPD